MAGLRGTEQLSVSLRLLFSGEDLEFMSAQLHSAITALMFLMMQVEFLYVCCDFGVPCDCLASTNRHLTLLTYFRLRASGHQTLCQLWFASVNDQAEQFR